MKGDVSNQLFAQGAVGQYQQFVDRNNQVQGLSEVKRGQHTGVIQESKTIAKSCPGKEPHDIRPH